MKMLVIFVMGRPVVVKHNLPDVTALAEEALLRSNGKEVILIDHEMEHLSKSSISCNCPDCKAALKKVKYQGPIHQRSRMAS